MNDTTQNLSTQRIEKQLENYLLRDTSYALLLTGGWGAGKTHFINQFSKKIKHQGFSLVMISVYGAKSVDDIKDRLLLGLYPFWSKTAVQATGIVAAAVLKSVDITTILGKGFLDSLVENTEAAAKKLKVLQRENINFEKLLICFDDLERADPKLLSSHEILGYINGLVDLGVKVLIIANEGRLKGTNFEVVKEKTIGRTIHFQQNKDYIFQQIVENSNRLEAFKKYLLENKHTILSLLVSEGQEKTGTVNFRTVRSFLSDFSDVFHYLQNKMKIAAINDKRTEILEYCLKFCLMLSNEFQNGKIDYLKTEGLEKATDLAMKEFYRSELGKESEKNYLEEMTEKYDLNKQYVYYQSLFSYFTGGDIFDVNAFEKEIRTAFNVQDQNIPEAYQVFNRLAAPNHVELEDSEYKDLLRRMRNYAFMGQYDLPHYMTVFYYLVRNGNVLRLNMTRLRDKLVKVIRDQAKTHVYNPMLRQITAVSKDSEYYELYLPMREAILAVNKKTMENSEFDAARVIEEMLEKDYDQLHKDLIEALNTPGKRSSLAGVRPKKFLSVFKKASNKQKSQMILLIRILYHQNYGNYLPEDREFVTGLKDQTDTYINNTNLNGNKATLWQELSEAALAGINRIDYMNQ